MTARRPGNARATRCLELRRQVDLRHEQERLPSCGDARRGGGEVDLRLAAAGNAVERERRVATLGRDDRRGGGTLIGVERDDGVAVLRCRSNPVARADHGCTRSAAARGPERRHHLREREAEWLLIVAGDESRELEEVLRQRRQLGDELAHRLQPFACDLGGRADGDDNTDERAPGEANPHERAPFDGEPRGHPVIERRRRSDGQGDARDRHRITRRSVVASTRIVVFEILTGIDSNESQVLNL